MTSFSLALVLHASPHGSAQVIEEAEVIEVTEPETPTSAGAIDATSDTEAQERGPFLGRLHPALVHMPLAWMVLLVLVDGLAFGFGQKGLEAPGFWLLALTVASLVPAVATGLVRAGEDIDPLLLRHRNAMLFVSGIATLALVLRGLRRGRLEGGARIAYLALVAVAALLILVGGHWGGALVYGEDFLF